tara:strand:- start:335 stop:436 length:102 start_codon:yes stop_codon:yes gene_type:complete
MTLHVDVNQNYSMGMIGIKIFLSGFLNFLENII